MFLFKRNELWKETKFQLSELLQMMGRDQLFVGFQSGDQHVPVNLQTILQTTQEPTSC